MLTNLCCPSLSRRNSVRKHAGIHVMLRAHSHATVQKIFHKIPLPQIRAVSFAVAFAIFLTATSPSYAAGPKEQNNPRPPPDSGISIPAAEQSAQELNSAMLRSVLTIALGFLTPRTLEPHTVQEFSMWGLAGISALDPDLNVGIDPKGIFLSSGQDRLLVRPVPSSNDLKAWADVSSALCAAAWSHSEIIRNAGQNGLIQSFFDELFNHLDPYSRYVAPASAETDREERSGGTADIGVSLGTASTSRHAQPSHIIISAVNASGPAWPAGIDIGDYLISVDGKSVAGHTPEEVQQWLAGDEGSTVKIVISSGPSRRREKLSLHRAVVPPETVFAFSSGSLMVLRLTSFSSETASEMSQYLDQAVSDGHLRGLILDLRGNRGGILQQAVTAAALLLDHGVAVITKGRDPQANHVWAVRGGDMTKGVPIVILVDGRTASAAEILAAALSDHRRAVVLGSATLGKGLVQTIAQMPNGGELFVTWSRVIAPLDWPLQGLGVIPQICSSRGLQEAHQEIAALDGKGGSLPTAPTLERRLRYPVPVSEVLELRRSCPAALGDDADFDLAREVLASHKIYNNALALIPEPTANAEQIQ